MSFVTKSNGKNNRYNPNDDILTPEPIAQFIINQLPIKETDLLYDPFKGNGAFYNNFPKTNTKIWSEIKENKDFFNEDTHVDWIISNPPYSKYTEVMKHSYDIAENIVYLIPLNKIVSSWGRCLDLEEFGGIVKLWIIQAGKCGFPFGFPACAVWIKKNYIGPIEYELCQNIE